MYTLESIQQFDGKRVGIYTFGKDTGRKRRKALRILTQEDEIPSYAIITASPRITKGTHNLYKNESSFVTKVDENDGTSFDAIIII